MKMMISHWIWGGELKEPVALRDTSARSPTKNDVKSKRVE
jgi:hypothetical protein